VVSSPARQRRGRRVGQPGDYATLIPTNLATAPGRRPPGYKLDTLDKHREAFAKAMRMTVEEMDCHDPEDDGHG
jgi:hypothetical protein